jgi:predicted Ser/Thr protein kinase
LLNNISKEIENKVLESIDSCTLNYLTEGWYGTVYEAIINNKKYALKVFKETMIEAIKNREVVGYDYEILKDLSKSKYYPTLHAYKENEWMLSEFVEGIPFREAKNKELYYSQLFKAYRDSVNAGWYPDDIKGNNLMLSGSKIFIIDVGSFLPVKQGVNFNIEERVEFILRFASVYPSVRDTPPYIY